MHPLQGAAIAICLDPRGTPYGHAALRSRASENVIVGPHKSSIRNVGLDLWLLL